MTLNMPVPLPMPVSAFRIAPLTRIRRHGQLTLIQSLRHDARLELAIIADEAGQGSTLMVRCREAWNNWEREAIISVLHGDYPNAEVILDRGVHALRQVLTLTRIDHLSEDDLVSLIAAV
jgi:hypothetical protein